MQVAIWPVRLPEHARKCLVNQPDAGDMCATSLHRLLTCDQLTGVAVCTTPVCRPPACAGRLCLCDVQSAGNFADDAFNAPLILYLQQHMCSVA